MRVLHLAPPTDGPDRLTAHTFIDEEIGALRKAGIDCITLPHGLGADGRTRKAAVAFAVQRVTSLPLAVWRAPRETLHAIRIELTAAKFVRDRRVDVVHSHFGWPAGFGGVLATAIAGVPLVASLRGMDLLTAPDIAYGLRCGRAYDAALRQLLRGAARTLYATEFMRRNGIATGAPAERAMLIRKGVDVARFYPGRSHADVPVVLAVGSLSPRKNLRVTLDALARIADLAWRFIIVGEGTERPALEAHAASLGIGARVCFAGSIGRDEIGAVFASADVFVHGAMMEAAGNVILEALAAGCPVVCTDAGGPTEYVRDGETGFVVPCSDAAAMSFRVRALIASRTLREQMARAARASAEREFAYDRMIAEYIAVYDEVIEHRDGHGAPPVTRSPGAEPRPMV